MKTLIVSALEIETQGQLNDYDVLYTGVGKVNATLKSHFEKVGQTMSKEWASKAGSRGQTVLSKY